LRHFAMYSRISGERVFGSAMVALCIVAAKGLENRPVERPFLARS
jgi:hypothetical protein